MIGHDVPVPLGFKPTTERLIFVRSGDPAQYLTKTCPFAPPQKINEEGLNSCFLFWGILIFLVVCFRYLFVFFRDVGYRGGFGNMFEVCFKDKQRPSMRFHQIVIFQGWWKSMNFVRRQMMVVEPLSTL